MDLSTRRAESSEEINSHLKGIGGEGRVLMMRRRGRS